MRSLMFAVSLVGAFALNAAALAPKTYVVPAGTAGNTPEAPYDTWAKAANDLRLAAAVTATNETMYVLSGDYSAIANIDQWQPEQNIHVKIVATQDEAGAPGKIYTFNKFTRRGGTRPNEDSRHLYIDYGTLVMKPNSANSVFFEYGDSAGYAQNSHIISGASTVLDVTNGVSSAYLGYLNTGYEFTVRDHAKAYLPYVTAGHNKTKLTIADGAEVRLSSSLHYQLGLSDGVVTISNAEFKVHGQCLVGNANSKNMRWTMAGERPYVLVSNGSAGIYGAGSALEFDVSEMPIVGYAEKTYGSGTKTTAGIVNSGSSFGFKANAALKITGMAKFVERLVANGNTGTKLGDWQLIYASGGIVDDSNAIAAANAELTAAGYSDFYVYVGNNNRTVYLTMVTPETVYVVPAGTAGNSPTPPYSSWATAANEVRNAAEYVATHGLVKVAEGSYAAARFVPDQAIRLSVVKSPTDDAVGTLSITNGGSIMGCRKLIDSPDYNSLNLAGGTLKMATVGNNNVFIEYPVGGGALNNYCKFAVSGANTVFDCSGKVLYAGYISPNLTMSFVDHCLLKCAALWIGGNQSTHDDSMLIGDGATVQCENETRVGFDSDNIALTVSNATLNTWGFSIGGNSRMAKRNTALFVDNAVMTISTSEFKPFVVRSKYSSLIVDNSEISFAGKPLNLSVPGTNNTLVVQNGAKLSVASVNVGTDGLETGFTNIIDNAAIEAVNAYALNDDATLIFDVSKIELDGTAPKFVKAGSFAAGDDTTLVIDGVQDLLDRMAAAEPAVESLNVTLIATDTGATIPDATMTALTAALPTGAKLVKGATSLKLKLGKNHGLIIKVQ